VLAQYNDNKASEILGRIPKNCSGHLQLSHFTRVIETALLDNRVVAVTAVLGGVRDSLSSLSEIDAEVLFHKVLLSYESNLISHIILHKKNFIESN
jgi:hypothetical protein